ncbi:MAG: hypothetical protein JSS66_05175 [Armatimonadetes bacterium]|nr:hypothetical protein [Armatimonadota bacterium]
MADRIFINKDTGQYSERELNRIDWNQVRSGMIAVRKAANAGATLNPFGMVSGIFNPKVAQVLDDMDSMDSVVGLEDDTNGVSDDSGNIDMVAEAINGGGVLEPDMVDWGLEHSKEVAEAMGMSPMDVESALHEMGGSDMAMTDTKTPFSDFDSAGPSDSELSGIEAENPMSAMASTKTAKRKLPTALEKFKFTKKDKGGSDPEQGKETKDDKSEDSDEDGADAAEAKGNERKARKIVFTSPEQLSSEALEAARKAGDEDLVRATLAARAERRRVISQAVANNTLEQLTREAKTKRRQAAKQEKTQEVQATVKTEKKSQGVDFVKPTELNNNQKSAFASKARELGFPEPYIQHFLGVKTAGVTEDDVRRVAEGEGSYKEKAERVASMIREANLESSDRERILKFWVEELGYPRDYVEKMVENYHA